MPSPRPQAAIRGLLLGGKEGRKGRGWVEEGKKGIGRERVEDMGST